MSTIDRIGILRLAVERATVISGQPFDGVLAKLAAAVVTNAIPIAASATSHRMPPCSVPIGFAC